MKQQLRVAIVAWLVLVAMTGCTEPNARTLQRPADGAEIPILRQVSGRFGGPDRPMRLVIRDQATLAQVPLVDVPVDFANEMMLVVTLGRRMSDQYSVQITRVWRQGPELAVDYAVTAPSPDAPTAISSPFCIAVVPQCDLNVDGFSPIIPRGRTSVPDVLQDSRDVPGGTVPRPPGTGQGTRRPGTANIRRR